MREAPKGAAVNSSTWPDGENRPVTNARSPEGGGSQ
jgi:hypothetical protein